MRGGTPSLAKSVEEIVEGVARVDDEGEIELEGQGDLGGKGLSLLGFRGMFVVVVEPALPDSHQARVTRVAPAPRRERDPPSRREGAVRPWRRSPLRRSMSVSSRASRRTLRTGAHDDDSFHARLAGAHQAWRSPARSASGASSKNSSWRWQCASVQKLTASLVMRGKSGLPFSTAAPRGRAPRSPPRQGRRVGRAGEADAPPDLLATRAWRARSRRRPGVLLRARHPSPRPRALPGSIFHGACVFEVGVGRAHEFQGRFEGALGREVLPRLGRPRAPRSATSRRDESRCGDGPTPAHFECHDGRDARDEVAEVVREVGVVARGDAFERELAVVAEGRLAQQVVAQRVDAELLGEARSARCR